MLLVGNFCSYLFKLKWVGYNSSLKFSSREHLVCDTFCSLCFYSIQFVNTPLVLIRTDNFSVKCYGRFLTDELTLVVLRGLKETILKTTKRRVIIIAMRICESWTSKKQPMNCLVLMSKLELNGQVITAATLLKFFTKMF